MRDGSYVILPRKQCIYSVKTGIRKRPTGGNISYTRASVFEKGRDNNLLSGTTTDIGNLNQTTVIKQS
jgi:hypothetical protein